MANLSCSRTNRKRSSFATKHFQRKSLKIFDLHPPLRRLVSFVARIITWKVRHRPSTVTLAAHARQGLIIPRAVARGIIDKSPPQPIFVIPLPWQFRGNRDVMPLKRRALQIEQRSGERKEILIFKEAKEDLRLEAFCKSSKQWPDSRAIEKDHQLGHELFSRMEECQE